MQRIEVSVQAAAEGKAPKAVKIVAFSSLMMHSPADEME